MNSYENKEKEISVRRVHENKVVKIKKKSQFPKVIIRANFEEAVMNPWEIVINKIKTKLSLRIHGWS